MPKQPLKTKNFENLLITKIDLEAGLRDLQFIEQCIILFRFYEDEKLEKVAARLDMNTDTVLNMERNIIKKLRRQLLSRP